jgi:hypothetical protein
MGMMRRWWWAAYEGRWCWEEGEGIGVGEGRDDDGIVMAAVYILVVC